MTLSGKDDSAPVFVRETARSGAVCWVEIGEGFTVPECHPHDAAWIISILHGITTKSLGQVFEGAALQLGLQQIKALCDKYTKFYINEIDRTGSVQLARRAANARLLKAAKNFAKR